MTQRYAILELYFGLCNSSGLSEGRFDKITPETPEYSRSRFFRAMNLVRKEVSVADNRRGYCSLK